MGIGLVPFQRIHQRAVIEEVNPFIQRDLGKCILCAKCIRADQELVVEGAIDYMHRGFSSKPATLNDLPLEQSECTFCGTCVAQCPTGALSEREGAYGGTTSKVVHTVCPFCGCGCGILLEVKDDRIVRARPNEKGSNQSTLCVRGCYGYDFVHSPERLTNPLVRVGDDFEVVAWEQALDLVANELGRIKEAHGPGSLGVLGSSKCTNEENYLLQRFARAVLGTNNIDNGSRLYSAVGAAALRQCLGFAASTNPLHDIEKSEVILVIGADPTASAPVVGYAIKRAVRQNGAKLLLIDPRRTKLVSFAEIWLTPKTGTDAALINGLMKVIVDEDLWHKDFVAQRTENFVALTGVLGDYAPDYVAGVTGVSAEDMRRAARLFARAGRASIVYGNGLTQQPNGAESALALVNLALLSGCIGRGGGIFALQRENNGQGACDMGALPDFLPGYQGVEDISARHKFEQRWEVSLPAEAGLTALEMIQQAKEGNIRGMYIMGENPALSFPHLSLVREALASLDFLVVQDMFLTETAKLAKVVLPAASFVEKEGTFTNFERRVQRIRKAIEPPGDSWPDWQIIMQLSSRMNYPMHYSSPQQVMDEITELIPLYQRMDYAYLDTEGAYWPASDRDPRGMRQLYQEGFPRQLALFTPTEYMPQLEPSTDGYPFRLLAGTTLYHFGSGTRSSRSPRLRKMSAQAFVEVNEADAEQLEIDENEVVRVISPQGEIVAPARITDGLLPGTLFMPISSPVNELFALALGPGAKAPSLKVCAVRLERIDLHGSAGTNTGS
jgi:formate dehydrogenase alpha subunit